MEHAEKGNDCTVCVRAGCAFCDAYHYGHDYTKFYRCSDYRRLPQADEMFGNKYDDVSLPSASFNVTICPEENTLRITAPDGSNPRLYYLDTHEMYLWMARAIRDWVKNFAAKKRE